LGKWFEVGVKTSFVILLTPYPPAYTAWRDLRFAATWEGAQKKSFRIRINLLLRLAPLCPLKGGYLLNNDAT